MNILPTIAESTDELEAIYRDLHAHPEIGFTEVRTSGIVADKLRAYGVDEVHTGLGKTGVVGIIRGKGQGNRRVGLRADMDALPIHETTGLEYASQTPGVMHACGHDSHTTMLLGAAKHLAATREFDGTAVVVFQPAEEGMGGAKLMLEEGLFEKFPCDEIFGMHNRPNGKPGTVGICKGEAMAGAAFFDIEIKGKGSHAARPDQSRDALMVASSLATKIHTIVARNIPAQEVLVLSVTQLNAGSAYNVVPENATLGGTIRYFKDDMYDLAAARMQSICDGMATMHDVDVTLTLRPAFDVLINDAELSDVYMDAAGDIVGADNLMPDEPPVTGSEDFADMLRVIPGAYCTVGHAGTMPLHNPEYVLDTSVLPIGASVMARVVEKRLPLTA
ncbi:M20 aminoacylase family protein [Sulfitobacter aestuariivivens]|uniref:Amidohydrolase n=1 Tax=Sulfitobacter aestuariivivens TaxID=2766981 RepID=A0A927HH14_9RHOB|nr:M20 aminoacylase family protein [Sulfitobacter aestuariivivens]MBD3664810.1 amidohydrolase [Sulfitobacter aestuariivivens]